MAAHLPEVEPQYKNMAQSLDNTRHLMKTDELIVPSEGVCVRACVCACVCVYVCICVCAHLCACSFCCIQHTQTVLITKFPML